MGIMIQYFLDTDMENLSSEEFLREFKKRVEEKCEDFRICDNYNCNKPFCGWEFCIYDKQYETCYSEHYLSIEYTSPELSIELILQGKVFCVMSIIKNHKELYVNSQKLSAFKALFEEGEGDFAIESLMKYIGLIENYILPITHSTKLLMIGDQWIDTHDAVDHMLWENKTIDEALKANDAFEEPASIFTWENIRYYFEYGIILLNLKDIPHDLRALMIE